MRRRDFLAALLAAGAARPLYAQSPVHHVAVCSQFGIDSLSSPPWTWAFARLQQIGLVEGRNLILSRYATEGHPERNPEIARKMVEAKPDVIALGFDHELILQVAKETATIPIIAAFGDPVAAGIITNMARPERNITGVSLDAGIEMQGKHLELLREAVPAASRIAYLSNRTEWEGAWGQAVRDAGERTGATIIGIALERSAGEPEYRKAFETMAQLSVQALMFNGLPPNFEHRELILELATKYRLPSITWFPDLVENGKGFLAYALDYPFYWRLYADELAELLKGVPPAKIPIQQPTKLILAISLKTARRLGITVPPTIASRADVVTE